MVKSEWIKLVAISIIIMIVGVHGSGIDWSLCAIQANQTYWENPNGTFLHDRNGDHTSDISQAWGISYDSCVRICHAPEDNGNFYTWSSLSQGLQSWFLPWFTLTAQLPYGTMDRQSDLMAFFLALGSPALASYSLAIHVFNSRTINRKCRHLKELYQEVRLPGLLEAIQAMRVILIESQHIPVQVYNGCERGFAQLVVCPQNWIWWTSLKSEIQSNKRRRTFSLYAQVGYVSISQVLAIIDFFMSRSSVTNIGIGLAINTLWIWMVFVVGWVFVGPQTSSDSIKKAISKTAVPKLGQVTDVDGKCIGIKDRTVFDDSCSSPYLRELPNSNSQVDCDRGQPILVKVPPSKRSTLSEARMINVLDDLADSHVQSDIPTLHQTAPVKPCNLL